jgi:hypothetical protein
MSHPPHQLSLRNSEEGGGRLNSASIAQELRDEHGVTIAVLRCPCCCEANSLTGHPVRDCPHCHGEGKIQYGIDEVKFA